jgi:general secretion pathway protein C
MAAALLAKAMDVLVNRYWWAINALAVGLCGMLLGRAVAGGLQLGSKAGGVPSWSTSVRAVPQPPFPRAATGEIAARNVFCSGCPPLRESAASQSAAGPRPCTLPLQLLAVNQIGLASPGGYATAVLRDSETRETGGFAVGDRVKGAAVTAIGGTRVQLDNAGVTEFLDLIEPAAPAPVPATAARVNEASPAAAGDPLAQDLARGIRKIGEHRYELSRATLESVLGNMNLLAQSAQIIPEVREGRSAGFRFARVRPGAPFDLIGLRAGDVVSAINGLELTSADKALEVYTRLKSASHLSLGIERGGQRITNEYTVR